MSVLIIDLFIFFKWTYFMFFSVSILSSQSQTTAKISLHKQDDKNRTRTFMDTDWVMIGVFDPSHSEWKHRILISVHLNICLHSAVSQTPTSHPAVLYCGIPTRCGLQKSRMHCGFALSPTWLHFPTAVFQEWSICLLVGVVFYFEKLIRLTM